MNIMFFLTPKSEVTYIYDTYTIRQALEKVRRYGYTAVPVIDRDGHYIGSVTEGDFLRRLLDGEELSLRSMEHEVISSLERRRNFEAVTINTNIEDLFTMSMKQNFVPVVDDKQVFIGIVTRKDIIKYCYDKLQSLKKEEP